MSSKIKINVEQKLKSLWMERVVDKSAFSVVHCNQIGQVKGTFLMNNIQSGIVTQKEKEVCFCPDLYRVIEIKKSFVGDTELKIGEYPITSEP